MSMFLSPNWRLLARKGYSAPRKHQFFAILGTFLLFALLATFLLIAFLRLYFLYNAQFAPLIVYRDVSKAAQNETLGFTKAFYISLPSRSDRQDAMELMGAMSNLTLTYQPGVLGSNMSEKAKNSDGGYLRDEQWGCWRSHADVWKRVIDEKLDTALILEDDVDWDVNIHDIFEVLSRQMRQGKLRKTRMSPEEEMSAPYGFDWDLLYVGSCYNIPEDPRPKSVIYHDPNAPGLANISSTFLSEMKGWGIKVTDNTHKRVLAPSWYPVCTFGYAVTQRGARRLLYNVGGVKPIGSPIDLAMNDQIKRGTLKSYTIIPPLITAWKTGGVLDSDIDDMKKKEKELEDGEKLEVGSQNLWSSARVRMNETLGNLYPVDED